MKLAGQIALAALFLAIAAVLDAGLSRHLAIGFARPGFMVVVALSYALCVRPGSAAGMACASGILQGCLSGASMTVFTLGRTVVAFFFGFLERVEISVALPLGAALVALGTGMDGLVTMLIAPPSDLGSYARATIGSAVYNGALAFPIYWLVRRVFRNKDD